MERANKEVNRHLRAFTFDSSTIDDYRLCIPMVQRIMNATFSDRTKLSPSQILFGNALDLDRGILAPPKERAINVEPLSEYMTKLLKVQRSIIDLAKKNIVFKDTMHFSN